VNIRIHRLKHVNSAHRAIWKYLGCGIIIAIIIMDSRIYAIMVKMIETNGSC
jgi:hypothetical protein